MGLTSRAGRSGARARHLLAVALLLPFALIVAGCAVLGPRPRYDDEVKNTVAFLGRSVPEIVQRLGEPARTMNIEGIGYLGYERYGFFFDDAVVYYKGGAAVRAEAGKARVVVVDCRGAAGLMGIRRESSGRAEVVAALGRPDREIRVDAGEEIFNPFAGDYLLYEVDDDYLGFRMEGGKVASLVAIGGGFDLILGGARH